MKNLYSTYRMAWAAAASAISIILFLAVAHPDDLTNVNYLSGFLFLELLVAIIWNYRKAFFPFVILIFLLAGTDLPLGAEWNMLRWFVLGAGALAGIAIYFRDPSHRLGSFHLSAMFCVLAGLASAVACSYPKQAVLKALSLFLLFAYSACGVRLAVAHREQNFLSGMLAGCELLVYFSAVAYFLLHNELFGNPNSLGMVMGVVAVPLMLYGMLAAETAGVRRRRTFALLVSVVLLLSSYARAGEVAAIVSSVVLCAALGRYRLLVKGIALSILIAIAVSYVVPLPNSSNHALSLKSRFLFKGKEEGGVLGSRKSVWDTTIASIEQHPWFGTGFGTSSTDFDKANGQRTGTFASSSETTREHGNSFFAIIEGVGLLGTLPFLCLILFTMRYASQVVKRLWITKDSLPLRVAIASVLIAGLVHATFEDWLFAVGNYMCIFFWTLAFILPDVLSHQDAPATEASQVRAAWQSGAALPAIR